MGPLTETIMRSALSALDAKLANQHPTPLTLIIGGGGAMILAHHFPIATTDIDAIPKELSSAELDPWIKEIAEELKLPHDWLNPYYGTFSHVLPRDYGERLITVFQGKFLKAQALGKEEMLIMKCFAHRRKDVGHARALVRAKADLDFVENRIQELFDKKISQSEAALDFFQEILELEGL